MAKQKSYVLITALVFVLTSQSAVAATKSLAKDPRVSKPASFAAPQDCMTIDATSGDHGSRWATSGFPRPESTIPGKINVNILLLPVNFSDYKFTVVDRKSYQEIFKNASAFFSKQSYGRFKPNFIFAPENYWVTLAGETKDHGISVNQPQQDNSHVAADVIAAAPAELNLSSYDGVIVATGFYKETGGAQAMGSANIQSKSGVVKNSMLIFGRGMVSWVNIVHETGHALFGLEDLYLFQKRDNSGPQNSANFTAWDLMAGSTPEFSGWNKLLMGFIHQDELRCVAKKTKRTVFLSATNLVDGPKLGVINVAPGVSNCFEARKDFDGKTGLLVYQVNTNFDHGNGPFWGEEELLKQGGSLDFEGSKFKVLATSSAGVLVQVNA